MSIATVSLLAALCIAGVCSGGYFIVSVRGRGVKVNNIRFMILELWALAILIAAVVALLHIAPVAWQAN